MNLRDVNTLVAISVGSAIFGGVVAGIVYRKENDALKRSERLHKYLIDKLATYLDEASENLDPVFVKDLQERFATDSNFAVLLAQNFKNW